MRRFPFYLRILLAMAAGAALGLAIGTRAAPLGEAGKVLITLIKALAAPLLFFAILDAFLRTNIAGRSAARMVAISLTNAAIALLVGLTLSNLLRPGEASQALRRAAAAAAPGATAQGFDFARVVSGLVPTSIGGPFVDNAILAIVVLAVLLGAALRRVKSEQAARGETGWKLVEDGVAALLRTFEIALTWIIAIVPLAVFGVVAQTVGSHGFAPFAGLGPYVGVALLGLAIQVFVVYMAWLGFAGVRRRWFWAGARDPVVYAAGASSSLATLPVTLRSLDRMGVSPASARLAACVGTNLNNDGILLYEAMAVLFVAQAHGIPMSLSQAGRGRPRLSHRRHRHRRRAGSRLDLFVTRARDGRAAARAPAAPLDRRLAPFAGAGDDERDERHVGRGPARPLRTTRGGGALRRGGSAGAFECPLGGGRLVAAQRD
jgi:DAACS family dicarboxylate/amino acid:cation (Na+ or H+) symporter